MCFFKLFDAQIQTILLYVAEIWEIENCHILENVHLYAMKTCLRVPIFTPNVMIYGDTGRYKLWINAILRSIKYWLKIFKMSESRYVRKVYDMMRHDDTPDNWAWKIKEVLYRYNCVGYIYGNHNMLLIQIFLLVISEKEEW